MASNEDLNLAVAEWRRLKNMEEQAKTERQKIEDYIRSQAGIKEDAECTAHLSTDRYKLTLTAKLTRNVDVGAVLELRQNGGFERAINAAFDFKPTLRMSGYRALADADKAAIDKCITAKPARMKLEITDKE